MENGIRDDAVFKYIFSKENNLKYFLELALKKDIKVNEIYTQFHTEKDFLQQKDSYLDIVALINDNEIVNIEMQKDKHNNYEDRIIIYLSKLESSTLLIGQDYKEAKHIMSINICDFILFENTDNYHTIWKFREEHNLNMVMDNIELHFFELPKLLKCNPDLNDELTQLLAVIDGRNKEWMEVAMNNQKVKEIKNQAEEFITSDFYQYLIKITRERDEFDKQCLIKEAKEEGKEEGITIGQKKGEKKEKILFLKQMLFYHYPTEEIEKLTGIPKDKFDEYLNTDI